jgi:flagellar biogenesis protein FliO
VSVRRTAALLLGTLLMLPSSALALTDDELAHIGSAEPSGSGAATDVGFNAGGAVLRALVGLVVVIAIILVVAKVLRHQQTRRGGRLSLPGGGQANAVEVLSTTPLGPTRALHLVRIADRIVLVGAGEGGIASLGTWGEDEARAAGLLPAAAGPDFDELLAAAGGLAPAAPRRSVLDGVRALTAR